MENGKKQHAQWQRNGVEKMERVLSEQEDGNQVLLNLLSTADLSARQSAGQKAVGAKGSGDWKKIGGNLDGNRTGTKKNNMICLSSETGNPEEGYLGIRVIH